MDKNELSKYISHSRDREYMSGIERDELRVKQTAEVFTPTDDVRKILNEYPINLFTDINKTFLDNIEIIYIKTIWEVLKIAFIKDNIIFNNYSI